MMILVDIWWEDVSGGQRCVAQKICVDTAFDLRPVTLKPKFPYAPYLLDERHFFIDIWWQHVVGGANGMLLGRIHPV
jgi:hypothetical protein